MINSRFDKVILWGYRLHTHTNSYVYAGFERAFKHMGFDVRWYFDDEDHTNENFDNCLFFAFSGQENNIPLNKSSKYILHNAHIDKYVDAGCAVLLIQTLHNEAIHKCSNLTKINDYTLIDRTDSVTILFTPWATDLLPTEFDYDLPIKRNRRCVWIGTYGDFEGIYQNGQQLQPYFDRCVASNIDMLMIDPWKEPVSFKMNHMLVRKSMLAPAVQGKWQVDNEYPPCRLFKNISYGNMGITNNKKANEILNCELVYDDDSEILFNKSVEYLDGTNRSKEIKSLMMLVHDNHTYVARINTIFKFI